MNSVTNVVPSPCVKVCAVKGDICEGCGRTLHEIGQWRHLSNQQKQVVIDRVATEWVAKN